MQLGALVYEEGEGARVDEFLAALAGELRGSGIRLAGAIQLNTDGGDRCRCDMTLEDLASGRLIDISERRGPEARGCRLDSFALEDAVGSVIASLEARPDLMILNRFGKREAEGHGFRGAIEFALANNVPVLIAISRANMPAWTAFAEQMGETLPFDDSAVLSWCLQRSAQARARTLGELPASAQPSRITEAPSARSQSHR
ncbi:MAG: DUF2478 domain-containing protein [Hyphomicrobiaceae bacterium]|nr:DUF2478 domain-containing protein [Hyphomicrobiaceae bacterium]